MTRRHPHRRHRRGHMPRGFVSKAQMRYFFANPYLRARFAHKEAHKAGMYSTIRKRLGYSPRYRALPRHHRSVSKAARRAARRV